MTNDCMILGDSIAKGVSDLRKDCTAYVQSGINSKNWNKKFWQNRFVAKTIVISLGSNDLNHIETREQLEYLRNSIDADRVLWILPANKKKMAEVVFQVAENFEDEVIELLQLSPDGVHPTFKGYKQISKSF